MTLPPAGWYPDPENPEIKKYWNGTQWVDIPMPDPVTDVPGPKVNKWVIIGVGVAIALAGITGGVWKWSSDRATELALIEEEQRLIQVAEEEAAREAAAAEREKEQEDSEREVRKLMVVEVEESIRKQAEDHVTDGLIDGPILSVSCNPLGAGSADILQGLTTVFECFVANVDNEDGTMSGHFYNATMNWETGSYTYGYGAP